MPSPAGAGGVSGAGAQGGDGVGGANPASGSSVLGGAGSGGKQEMTGVPDRDAGLDYGCYRESEEIPVEFTDALFGDASAPDAGAPNTAGSREPGQFACSVKLPVFPPNYVLDPMKVNVQGTTAMGPVSLYYVQSDARCITFGSTGWYYDDENHPTRFGSVNSWRPTRIGAESLPL